MRLRSKSRYLRDLRGSRAVCVSVSSSSLRHDGGRPPELRSARLAPTLASRSHRTCSHRPASRRCRRGCARLRAPGASSAAAALHHDLGPGARRFCRWSAGPRAVTSEAVPLSGPAPASLLPVRSSLVERVPQPMWQKSRFVGRGFEGAALSPWSHVWDRTRRRPGDTGRVHTGETVSRVGCASAGGRCHLRHHRVGPPPRLTRALRRYGEASSDFLRRRPLVARDDPRARRRVQAPRRPRRRCRGGRADGDRRLADARSRSSSRPRVTPHEPPSPPPLCRFGLFICAPALPASASHHRGDRTRAHDRAILPDLAVGRRCRAGVGRPCASADLAAATSRIRRRREASLERHRDEGRAEPHACSTDLSSEAVQILLVAVMCAAWPDGADHDPGRADPDPHVRRARVGAWAEGRGGDAGLAGLRVPEPLGADDAGVSRWLADQLHLLAPVLFFGCGNWAHFIFYMRLMRIPMKPRIATGGVCGLAFFSTRR